MIDNRWIVGAGLAGVALIAVAFMLWAGPEDCTMEIVGARAERVCE